MINGFIFICDIVAGIYLLNVITVMINLFNKKRRMKSKARINPYKFFTKVFWNMNDGYGTDVKVGIIPIVCTIMTVIGLLSIIYHIVYWVQHI